jgi:hypothetical protein
VSTPVGIPFGERGDTKLLQPCHQGCRGLSSPWPGLQRNEPTVLVPYWLSTPAMTLKCQLLVFAVFKP